MNFVGGLDKIEQGSTGRADRNVFRPGNLRQVREVPGIGSFQVLSPCALDWQEKIVQANKLPLCGLGRRHMNFYVSST